MSAVDGLLSRAAGERARGDLAAAEALYGRALAAEPGHVKALSGLSRVRIAQRRWAEAEALARQVLAAAPRHVEARYTLASARLEQGAAEAAEAQLSELIQAGVRAPQLRYVRGRARIELGALAPAKADLIEAWRGDPSPLTLKTLAGVYWMSGERAAFDALLAQAPAGLALAAAEVLRQAGELDAALARLRGAPPELRGSSPGWTALSVIHQDRGEAEAARAAAERALAMTPGSPHAADAFICAALMQGDGAAALSAVRPMRTGDPNNQHWIAHEAMALRALGDPDYGRLARYHEHVRVYDLPAPAGHADIAAFNAALEAALDAERLFKTHPLDQSLRGGAQTARGLTAMADPVVKAYLAALDAPIRAYLCDIGGARDHPMTARNTGRYRFAGAWSIRLGPGGRHVNHVHPEGWISSAYYVSVPDGAGPGSKAGWIKFGEPPFRCDPPMPPERWIEPEAGQLVLFPSFLWHGVEPILGGATRVTAPFDLVPA